MSFFLGKGGWKWKGPVWGKVAENKKSPILKAPKIRYISSLREGFLILKAKNFSIFKIFRKITLFWACTARSCVFWYYNESIHVGKQENKGTLHAVQFRQQRKTQFELLRISFCQHGDECFRNSFSIQRVFHWKLSFVIRFHHFSSMFILFFSWVNLVCFFAKSSFLFPFF